MSDIYLIRALQSAPDCVIDRSSAPCTGGYNTRPIAPVRQDLPIYPLAKKPKRVETMDLLGDLSLEAFIRKLQRR